MKRHNIKSQQRVRDYGEVFTPLTIVKEMLRQPEIAAKVNDLTATFLEPSAGEGVFLLEILRRRMSVALKCSKTAGEFGENALIALSGLYGVELMGDNEEQLVMNMILLFTKEYREGLCQWSADLDEHVVESAKTIIGANMVQGNTLTEKDSNNRPIVLSEWKLIPDSGHGSDRRVQRTETFFENGLSKGERENGMHTAMFSDNPATDRHLIHTYAPCRWVDIYKKMLVD